MENWTKDLANKWVLDFEDFSDEKKQIVLEYLNDKIPHSEYLSQNKKRKDALGVLEESRKVLSDVKQVFPPCLSKSEIEFKHSDLEGCLIFLTAGGDGERLKQSLIDQGISEEELSGFTKATFPLPDYPNQYGALQVNLMLIAQISKKHSINIPVIVSTGPEGSQTAELIPQIMKENNDFGLKFLKVIQQGERLHLTNESKIVIKETDNGFIAAVNPDETGGPIMSLKNELDLIRKLAVNRVILLQATGLYDPDTIFYIATAAKHHDCLTIGVTRQQFPESDPYGTMLLIEKDQKKQMLILESQVINTQTRQLRHPHNNSFLPYNTGIYAFDVELLQKGDLPNYASPAKEIAPGIPPAPKVGYAATDLPTFANNPGVLTLDPESFAVIKNADSLAHVAKLGQKYGLDKLF